MPWFNFNCKRQPNRHIQSCTGNFTKTKKTKPKTKACTFVSCEVTKIMNTSFESTLTYQLGRRRHRQFIVVKLLHVQHNLFPFLLKVKAIYSNYRRTPRFDSVQTCFFFSLLRTQTWPKWPGIRPHRLRPNSLPKFEAFILHHRSSWHLPARDFQRASEWT